MAVLKIARMGHPVLLRVADPVGDPTTPELRRLIADMAETLADAGGIGLAAPQVHVPLRLFIFRVPPERAGTEPDGQMPDMQVVADPVIEPVSDSPSGPDGELVTAWEGCLSIPGLRAAVPRLARIRYRGLDVTGTPFERAAAGLHARVVQHEADHLDGILYPIRMTDFTRFGFNEELDRYGSDL